MTVSERELAPDGAGGGSGEEQPSPRPARSMRLVLVALVAAGGLVVITFMVGFLWFAWRVPRKEVVLTTRADGIVAL
ncbi:MAG: hypothetical protein ACXWVA_10810, partial [Rhodoplanes sp.]